MKYEATIRNLSLGQAQSLYRLLVDLTDDQPFYGSEGMSWSGVIPGQNDENGVRTITIDPMRGEVHPYEVQS